MANSTPQQSPGVTGPIDRVPCPHCGKPNDFRDLSSQQLLDTGHRLFCDSCGNSMEIAAIRTMTFLLVRPLRGGGARPIAGPHDARTISPAQLQRLLKR